MQDLINISKNLKLEAISLLNKIDLESILKQYFNIYYTGSFSYDLMSWRDIDIVLQLKDDTQKVNNLFRSAFAFLINKDRIIKIYYVDTIHSHHKKGMPKGLCLGFDIYDQIINPDCSEVINNKWKIDM